MTNDLPDFDGGSRGEPYALNHPRSLKHSINFATTGKLTIYSEDLSRRHPARRYHIVTKQSLSATALIAAIGACFLSGWNGDWRREARFCPVSLPKFLILQTVTLGFCLFYWSFKNWRWVAETTSDTVPPRTFALFNSLSNFGLCNQLSHAEGRGLGWVNTLAPLFAAIVLFAANVDRYTSRAEVVEPGVMITSLLLTILAPVPAALETLKLNEDRPDIIRRKSRFTWPVIALILLFVQLFGMVLLGTFMPQ